MEIKKISLVNDALLQEHYEHHIFIKPTVVPTLHRQQIGRSCRMYKPKKLIILQRFIKNLFRKLSGKKEIMYGKEPIVIDHNKKKLHRFQKKAIKYFNKSITSR